MPIVCVIPQGIPEESDDAPKKFTNIDNEVFSQNWDGKDYLVQPGETVTHPKYLVNVMAYNLAKKIYKRQAFASFQGTEYEKRNAAIRFINPEEQWKLMKKIVASNYPEEKAEELKVPTAENVIDKTQVEVPPKPSFKCDKCEFTAKSKAGLLAHQRVAHKKVDDAQS